MTTILTTCDESHFYLYFSSFFPYIFNTITTKRWQVANKETLLQHSWALWPSWPSQSTGPSRLTQHYQDYDVCDKMQDEPSRVTDRGAQGMAVTIR